MIMLHHMDWRLLNAGLFREAIKIGAGLKVPEYMPTEQEVHEVEPGPMQTGVR